MNQIKGLSFLLAFIAVNNIVRITPEIQQFIYFGLMALIVFLSLIKSKNRVGFSMVWIIVACIISVVYNDIPSYFRPEQRLVIFIVSMLCLSPLLSGRYINTIKITTFHYASKFLIGITLLSFIGKVTGVYSGDNASGFSGITNHSMTLGVVAGISLIYTLFILTKKPINKKEKYRYCVVAFITVFTLILAGSRGALIAAILGVLVFVFKENKGKFTKTIKNLVRLSILLALTAPIWIQYTARLIEKNITAESEVSITHSRDLIWNYRLIEFNESPVIGIGLASAKYGLINKVTGQNEPGSSWGAIFAQIGLFGGIPFLLLILSYFHFLYIKKDINSNHSLLIGLLSFFAIHWISEGYMLSAGGFEFFYAWLLLGVIQVKKDSSFNLLR